MSLNKGTLKDNLGRIGYIADNYQFQFDGPPQASLVPLMLENHTLTKNRLVHFILVVGPFVQMAHWPSVLPQFSTNVSAETFTISMTDGGQINVDQSIFKFTL